MSSSVDPYAELASLFLTDGDSGPASIPIDGVARGSVRFDEEPIESRTPAPHHAVAPIEIALVGHLPVMGGLWLTQYADQVARREGPTALVRLERGQVSLELLRAPGSRGVLERAISVDEALAELGDAAARWIICPQNEASLDGPLPGDALSLLTGGDDAATVAAYRIMKNLAERWHIAGWHVPPIGLVVLGAPADRVEEVAEKLDRTTKAFLDVDLAIVGQHQRMDAIESASRRTFQGIELSVDDVCRRARECSRRGARRAAGAVSTGQQGSVARVGPTVAKLAPKPLGREVGPHSQAAALIEAMKAPAQRPPAEDDAMLSGFPGSGDGYSLKAVFGRSEEAREAVTEHVSHVPLRTEPERAAEWPEAPRNDADRIESGPSLTQAIPGLAAIGLRCPHHREIELAVDPQGTLHLVVLDTHLAALRPVEAWALAHHDLLRAACPSIVAPSGRAHDGQSRTFVVDVVTFDAPSIVALHGTGVRLHLLVETGAGLTHVALNRL